MAPFLSGSAVNWSVGTESADGDGDLVGESVAVVKVEKCAAAEGHRDSAESTEWLLP